ncbi:MAG TPA: murein L,D-transpeptidase catalytic domain family protein [Chitinophagaceae bacterium]|nr:murein L,D-transpeptidase catalytic domain family protein [Chitinophagaceae bacterium]
MSKPRTLLFVIPLAILSLAWFTSSGYWTPSPLSPKKAKGNGIGSSPVEYKISNAVKEKLLAKAAAVKTFAEQNSYNASLCFLVDMSLPSGQDRFFVFDLKKDSSLAAGLVTHGSCNKEWLEGRKFGNTVGCGCTSLGKYRVGNSYNGKFGLAFKLYGLDKTNSNAFNRFVVLHSHDCVPESEVKDEICQSLGCPTVSPGFLLKLKALIHDSKKPVLLWIYN